MAEVTEMKRIAVVISTYNNPRYLGFCLKSLTNQTHSDFEIFVADDGSTAETREKIAAFQNEFAGRLHHYWQDDQGFRKSKIHNDVFRDIQKFDLAICIDGDTFVHQKFIEDHFTFHLAGPRQVLMGRRVELGPRFSAEIEEKDIPRINRGMSWRLLLSAIRRDSRAIFRAVRVVQPYLAQWLGRTDVPDLIGSNFSTSPSLLLEVNGYDEKFTTYWGEDGDLFIRLRNAGASLKGTKALAVQYHLYHTPREATAEARAEYARMLQNFDYKRCENGILKERRSDDALSQNI